MSASRTTRFSELRRDSGDVDVVEKTTVTTTEKECEIPAVKSHHHHQSGYGGGFGLGMGLGMIVMWFIILTVFIWLIIFSLRPAWVLNSGSQEVNLAKVLGAALLIALILMIIIALIWWAVSAVRK